MNGRAWTNEEVEYLREHYPDTFAADIAQVLGRTAKQIWSKAKALGIKSSKEKIIRSAMMSCHSPGAKRHQFEKGHVPANKGKKMSPEMYARCQATMFKKGNRPVNHREVGSERINVDGYIEVKVAEPRTWRLKHRIVWEEANGPIPEGMGVFFINGISTDVRPENLCLKSMQQCLADNGIYNYPPELRELIRLKSKLNKIIKQNEEQ